MDSTFDVRRRPSLAAMIVWVLLCFAMWAWAIMMPLIIMLGVVDMLFHPEWLSVNLGATDDERLRNLSSAGVLAAVGLAFVVLRLRGHIRFGDRD